MGYERYAWLEIDLSAIAANVRTLKARAAQAGAGLFMAVVKADGYGHGAVEAALTAITAGADWIGVALVEEALELREAGIHVPILVLSEPPPSAAALLVRHGITSTLYTLPFAIALSREAAAHGVTAPFHLKVDTGMNRVGVRASDAVELCRSLSEVPDIRMGGVFTHFATADELGDWDFDRQLSRFRNVVDDLRTERIDMGIVHASNSPATILHPEAAFDMVRCGIAIYGLHPADSTCGKIDLEPSMSVKARVSLVKEIATGEGVSYGLTWRASGPTTVATLPLGYADGVHRYGSNGFDVLIDGRRCRQIGRVCMDQFMVEVPREASVRVGDEAVLVGVQKSSRLILDEVALAMGTINYEIACAFSRRLGRTFIGKGL